MLLLVLPRRQQRQADDATATAATKQQLGAEKPERQRSDAPCRSVVKDTTQIFKDTTRIAKDTTLVVTVCTSNFWTTLVNYLGISSQ
jgi:hypothetical protein